jgi:ribosome biogenesis GTPase
MAPLENGANIERYYLRQVKKGLVFKSTGKFYDVLIDDEIHQCALRGKIRLQGIRTTNPGVLFDVEMNEDGTGKIVSIHDRTNYIIRKSVNLSKEAQIIASNITRAFLLITLEKPQTTPGFIDRFLVTAEAYRIPVTLVFHKMDQYTSLDELADLAATYKEIGYDIIFTSLETNQGLDDLKERIPAGTYLFSGHSGVGKSSLVSRIANNDNIRIGDISDWSGKGQHTTTFAEIHPIGKDTYIVDTPGIKGFGLVDIGEENLAHYFPEFFERLSQCKFSNCKHVNEPHCAVIEAIKEGDIALSRYESYLSMLDDQNDKYRAS